ncbi:pirin family protein [Aquibaculum sediminis]|uniref:pirin family protein n=1 Tax=Aquibaculum sediminis TaxID=3231907 RepID=UPI0034518EB5
MSRLPDSEPKCPEAPHSDLVETVIVPRARDIGGFEVRRALPAPKRQMVGPFIFFDQMGPAEFITGAGIDVRPHPHIGLATVTYLFQGELWHRDSIGSDQVIYPGEVNWMVAGRGVTHSERSSPAARNAPHSLFGIQTWVALPHAQEEAPPHFEHHPGKTLPLLRDEGTEVRLILGTAWGETAPVATHSELFYADAKLEPGARLPLPEEHEDRGLYVVAGSVAIGPDRFVTGEMVIFRPGDPLCVSAGAEGARLILLGGATLDGPRYITWNFVASDKEQIEAAKAAWIAADFVNGPFRLPVGDDQEHIPFPGQNRQAR